MTERCGILLHPAGHTLSPLLHREAYRELGLDASYEVFDVAPAELENTLRMLREQGFRQLSVSLPHKEAVLPLADRVSNEARRIGAANTLTQVEGQLQADNTDWLGVCQALEPLGPWAGRRATVVGAGGAARAVVYALRKLDLQVCIVNRTHARAERLAAELEARVGDLDEPYELLVNATPLGMAPDAEQTPVPREKLRAGATVFDTVYRPFETRLLHEARAAGARTQDGLAMLLHQAAEQIRIWSGKTPDIQRLRAAAEAEL